jgi:starch-binding outer membrane protein SusE/F
MKKISFLLYIATLMLFSCEKDETIFKLKAEDDITPPGITSQTNGFSKTVLEANRSEEIEFAWAATGYGVDTQVTYTLQTDTECGTFETPVVIASTSDRSVKMTLEALSTKLVNDLKIAPHELSELQLRVTSTIKGNYLSVSEIVHISVSPWSDKPAGLWIGQGTNAQVLYNTTESVYEGYRYINAATSFKFANNRICADAQFGSSGPGTLSATQAAANINIADAGYYKFKVDTENFTYEIIKIDTWGMIGTATPNGWASSTAMNYNPTNATWEGELNLTNGALKFRANNDWGINYGAANVNQLNGNLVFDAAAIDIPEPGVYSVVIDFSQSKSPYGYVYSVSPVSNIPEPAALWLPGGYQGYNPAAAPKIYATGSNTFEGYVYISSNTGYKFTSAPDWVHTNYGATGTAGTLSMDGSAPDLSINQGYYKFNVNTADLTYTATLIETWGMIGTATSGGWDTSTPMTYDQVNNVWTATANLTIGALKFRANNGWGINYGVSDSNSYTGNLVFDASAAVDIKEDGNYTIKLDFSRTGLPYKYKYSVVKN